MGTNETTYQTSPYVNRLCLAGDFKRFSVIIIIARINYLVLLKIAFIRVPKSPGRSKIPQTF
jgi:hypothetical protein